MGDIISIADRQRARIEQRVRSLLGEFGIEDEQLIQRAVAWILAPEERPSPPAVPVVGGRG